MESNSNNNNDEEGRQVRRTARKREFTELTNDGQPTAEEEQTPQPTVGSFSKNKREEGKDNLENLYVESLSREDLIQFAKKQLLEKNEAQKKLETTKMAADESAHQTKELSQRIVLLDQERAKVNEDLAKKMAEIVELHKKVEEKSKMVAETEEQRERELRITAGAGTGTGFPQILPAIFYSRGSRKMRETGTGFPQKSRGIPVPAGL